MNQCIFAEAFDLQMGKTPSRDEARFWDGSNIWVSIADMRDRKYINSSKEGISDWAVKSTGIRVVPKGTVIMSFKLTIGKVCIATQDLYTNEAIMQFPIKPGYDILPEYLYYYLQGHKWKSTNNAVMGATLNKKKLSEEVIIYPSIEEQQRIVAELDLLSGIVEKKNAQLRTLDELASTIFYEMFGDPVSNEKHWPVKQLSSISTLLNGRAYKQDELLDKGKYKVLRVGNFFTNDNYYYSDLELEPEKYCDNGDLLFAWSASFGAFIWSGPKVIYHYHIWKVLFDEKELNKLYYQYLLNAMTSSFMKDVHGIGMVHLTKGGMEQHLLPIPPREMQEQFAKMIEALERCKRTLSYSLAAAQELLASRMDKYFNV